MTRSLCRAPHLWRCYLFRAATDTAIVPTNTRLEKTSGAELLYSRKLWLLWRRDRNKSNRRLSRSLCCQSASDFGVTRFNHGIDEVATPIIRQEGALHRVDG